MSPGWAWQAQLNDPRAKHDRGKGPSHSTGFRADPCATGFLFLVDAVSGPGGMRSDDMGGMPVQPLAIRRREDGSTSVRCPRSIPVASIPAPALC
jgi:hypothetical protein